MPPDDSMSPWDLVKDALGVTIRVPDIELA